MIKQLNLYAFKGASGPSATLASGRPNDRDARLMALDDDTLDAWNERVAICMVDGGLSQAEAEAVAWRQVDETGHRAQ
jgi:hypothetical protein